MKGRLIRKLITGMKAEKFGGDVLEAVWQSRDPLIHQPDTVSGTHRMPGLGFRIYSTEAHVGLAASCGGPAEGAMQVPRPTAGHQCCMGPQETHAVTDMKHSRRALKQGVVCP